MSIQKNTYVRFMNKCAANLEALMIKVKIVLIEGIYNFKLPHHQKDYQDSIGNHI